MAPIVKPALKPLVYNRLERVIARLALGFTLDESIGLIFNLYCYPLKRDRVLL